MTTNGGTMTRRIITTATILLALAVPGQALADRSPGPQHSGPFNVKAKGCEKHDTPNHQRVCANPIGG
jgi:hypothetical protein